MGTELLFLTRRALAVALGCGLSKVDRLERAGALPPRRVFGGTSGWLRSEVEAALAALPEGRAVGRVSAALAARAKKGA